MDIKKTIAAMTLEEKASLLSGADFWHTQAVERLKVKSVMVSDGPHGLRKQADAGDHLGINEAVSAVCFPAGCCVAASFDRDLIYRLGEAIGLSAQSEKVAVVLGPAVNIKRSPLCGRNFEYFSEDPYLAGEAAASYTLGVQSQNIGVSVKHFAANNQEHRRMSGDSIVDERTLREIYFPAFEAAVKRGKAWTFMCSYNRVNGVYAGESPWLLTKVLREDWGFDGYVMSDWGAVNDRVAGVKAGLDLEMPSSYGVNDKLVVEAVRAGTLDEKAVDLCCERILTIHQRYLDDARPKTVWDRDAQHALARHFASECMVLLKNDESLLPLSKDQKIAVIGPFAKTPRYQGGGSSHVNSFKVTSAWDELDALPNIQYAEGYRLDNEEPDEALMLAAEEIARTADAVILFAGLPDSMESEGYDRSDLHMPKCQEVLITRLAAINANLVVVLHNGSPVEMPWIDKPKAVLEAYLGGQAIGGAVVDVLFGEVNPSGRLPETFPLKLKDTPCYPWFGGEKDRVEYREGIFVGYRWYDKKEMDVLFPFGYGLSYTTFEYSNLVLSTVKMKDSDTLTVYVDIMNTGERFGREVVQLYVADRQSEAIRPVRELKEYAKVALEPGESKTVEFSLSKRAFAYWNTQLQDWHVESGMFGIQIGRSSREIVLEQDIEVTSTVEVPVIYTRNTIFRDIIGNPKLAPILEFLTDMMAQSFSSIDGGESAAITPEMMQAMLNDMPLRALLSFAEGKVSHEQMEGMIAQMNDLQAGAPVRE